MMCIGFDSQTTKLCRTNKASQWESFFLNKLEDISDGRTQNKRQETERDSCPRYNEKKCHHQLLIGSCLPAATVL